MLREIQSIGEGNVDVSSLFPCIWKMPSNYIGRELELNEIIETYLEEESTHGCVKIPFSLQIQEKRI